MTDLLDVLKVMAAAADGSLEGLRKTAMTTEVGDILIDTCDTVDAGWETGVQRKGGLWDIIEYYDGPEQAKIGHERWVKAYTENPDLKIRKAQEVEIISEDNLRRIMEERE